LLSWSYLSFSYILKRTPITSTVIKSLNSYGNKKCKYLMFLKLFNLFYSYLPIGQRSICYSEFQWTQWFCQFESRSGMRCTTLCDRVCQWLATSRWFSPGTLVSFTNKIDWHDITEILLKVAFNTIKHASKRQTDHIRDHLWPQILFRNGSPSHVGDRKTFEMIT